MLKWKNLRVYKPENGKQQALTFLIPLVFYLDQHNKSNLRDDETSERLKKYYIHIQKIKVVKNPKAEVAIYIYIYIYKK